MKLKRSVRLTRRSYRRKLVMFGVSIFMSLALTATGFAAWVLSKDSNKTESGEVQIGAVTEASVEITDIEFIRDEGDPASVDASKFVFEPLEDDTTGRVRYDSDKKEQPENLDVKFTWTVKNFQIVGDLFVDFKVPVTVYTAIENDWLSLPETFELQNAVEQIEGVDYKVLRYTIQNADKKITANVDLTDDKVLSYKVTKDDDGVITEVEFTMNIAFSWGAEFDGKNPGIYYDTTYPEKPAMGTGVPYETVKETLNRFKTTLHGINYDKPYENSEENFEALSDTAKQELYDNNPVPTYFIVINAKVA